ncbi:MAG TPA: metallophosphoesterase family protein [Chthoniobacterales bacterium]|nr:metallophosphoesterase family protein [Chthoniobacterales bacterium]
MSNPLIRVAILSDLHANLEATEAVREDARERECTHFICLGDVVGYNANPHECVEIVQKMECPVVKGNHDEQASLTASSRDFNALAEAAINWTREHLTDEDKEWLRQLRLSQQEHGFTIVHATLDEPGQWGYVFNNLDAVASFAFQETTVCFFGHTHVPGAFVRDDGVKRVKVDQLTIESSKKYFINVGSVGQPRDGDWRAAYCIYHLDKNVVEQRRVRYDLANTQKKIIQAGLPRMLADRLKLGR